MILTFNTSLKETLGILSQVVNLIFFEFQCSQPLIHCLSPFFLELFDLEHSIFWVTMDLWEKLEVNTQKFYFSKLNYNFFQLDNDDNYDDDFTKYVLVLYYLY
jgi:hypothetical protein